MGKVIDLTYHRCFEEYLLIYQSETGKAELQKDWKKRYPRAYRLEILKQVEKHPEIFEMNLLNNRPWNKF